MSWPHFDSKLFIESSRGFSHFRFQTPAVEQMVSPVRSEKSQPLSHVGSSGLNRGKIGKIA